MGSPTPMVEIDGIHVKLECVNPTGSIKDRIAEYIVDESERLGLLKPGMTIVEATSGNTGIALASYGRKKGYKVVIVMPENMTEERKRLIMELGADLFFSGEGDFAGAVEIRDELARAKGYFNPDQFSNELNAECHYKTTGQEILEQSSEAIDAFVAGVGTGGSLIGIGRALRERYPAVKIIAVEPEESAVMSGGSSSPHRIFGIGDGFVPPIAQSPSGGLHEMIDEVTCVSSGEALDMASALRARQGYCVGTSSGANFLAAKRAKDRFGKVVTLFPDGYARYQTHGLCQAIDPVCPFASLCQT